MQEKLNTDELLQKLERLIRENERLKSILSAHGISYEQNPSPKDEEVLTVRSNADNQGLLSKEQILQQRKNLFRSLFKGREDVFALRWTSSDGSKSGYMPACSNRWTSLCDRKKYKCANCPNRQFVSLGDAEIEKHLRADHPMCHYRQIHLLVWRHQFPWLSLFWRYSHENKRCEDGRRAFGYYLYFTYKLAKWESISSQNMVEWI